MTPYLKKQVIELQQRRVAELKKAEDINAAAVAAGRDLTSEERASFDAAMQVADGLQGDIRRISALREENGRLTDSAGRLVQPDTNLDLSERERKGYSLFRAIRAMADQKTGKNNAWAQAGFELEASQEIAKRLGKDPKGFFVPFDIQTERRDQTVGTATAGGNLVATDLLTGSLIELLSNRMVVQQAGARMLTGLVGNVAIPRQTSGASAYWVAESGSPTESQAAFDQISLTPKTLGAFVDISRRLLLQTSLDAEQFVRNDIAATIAREADRVGLHGSGSGNEPRGVQNVVGINAVVGGTNGAAPTWPHIVKLETEIAADNADLGALAYITNTKVRGKLKETEKFAGGGREIWQDGATPLNGYAAYVSNQVLSNLTKGSSSGVCSAIFFANWADLIYGNWGVMDVLVDPYTGGTSGTLRVISLVDMDVIVRHPESFCLMADALTA